MTRLPASLRAICIAITALILPTTALAQDAPTADAGASTIVNAGDYAALIGAGYGGTPPYTFAWTTDAGTVMNPSNPTTGIQTDGLDAGRYLATLTITDADGATATDSVQFAVVVPTEGDSSTTTLLDEEREDATPGGQTETIEFPFEVPPGLASIEISVNWTQEAVNDYDLRVLAPDGSERASSGQFGTGEFAGVGEPEAGTWIAAVDEYASAGAETLRVIVQGIASAADADGADSLPAADAGGTYEFLVDAEQTLAGTIEGGTPPLTAGWDTDLDGVVDLSGTTVNADLPRGHNLVRFVVTDSLGYESQQMTSVLVGTDNQIRDSVTPITIIGISDSGINPYHSEFSAATYPDPAVLKLTRNFTRHPSEYIPGFPKSARAIPMSLDGTYFPERDTWMWEKIILREADPSGLGVVDAGDQEYTYIQPGNLYWVPGTKIIGALTPGTLVASNTGDDAHPILDDNGHGTGSASVSAGNRYGYCPTCLVVMVEALDEPLLWQYPWIDITSHSHGYVGGAPIGYLNKGLETLGGARVGAEALRATERGTNVLYAAGNGVGNAFDVPQNTYASDQTGPNWTLTVGALRRDNQGAITGDGIPAHISAWGDGNLPSACRTGFIGQCAFGGTSAATPYTAGTFGWVLTEVRKRLGDGTTGPKPGQIIAQGRAIDGSPYLGDGILTRRELRAVMLKTAAALNETGEASTFAFPATYTGEEGREAFEGYGAASPNAATRALAVLTGAMPMPARAEDTFFQQDCAQREAQYGQFDQDGDGTEDGCDMDISGDPIFVGDGTLTTAPANPDLFASARPAVNQDVTLSEPITYYLHRIPVQEADVEPVTCGAPQTATENFMEQYIDRVDSPGDSEPCFDSRITSTAAAFRPKGIFASTDVLEGTLPAGSQVEVFAYVQTVGSGATQITGRLMATDRILGESATVSGTTTMGSWTEYNFTFTTDRPAFRGEQLTWQFTLAGQPEWAYGHEGDHTSRFIITPAAAPDAGDEFGATVDTVRALDDSSTEITGQVAFPELGPDALKNAGFHPVVHNVQISVNDDTFADPFYAQVIDVDAGTYRAIVPVGSGNQFFARALRDRTPSLMAASIGNPPVAQTPVASTPATGAGGALGLEWLAMLVGLAAWRRRIA